MFKKYLDSQIKIVFKDGDHIIVKYGKLTSVSNEFIEFVAEGVETILPISAVIKIARKIEDGDKYE